MKMHKYSTVKMKIHKYSTVLLRLSAYKGLSERDTFCSGSIQGMQTL